MAGIDPSPLEPQRQEAQREARTAAAQVNTAATFGRGAAYIPLPTFENSQPKPKPNSVPMIAGVCVAAALAVGVIGYASGFFTPVAVQESVLTVTEIDVNQEATARAILEINAGTSASDPLIANLPDSQKQEIVAGKRKIYTVPAQQPDEWKSTAPLPAPQPAPIVPQTQPQPQSQSVQPQAQTAPATSSNTEASSDRISVSVNGLPYGTFTIAERPITLNVPFEIGDSFTVTCLSVESGKGALQVGLVTGMDPVQTHRLAPGDSQTFHVHPAHEGDGNNYEWAIQEANKGNPVAEYEYGYMFKNGFGVPKDRMQAIHWFSQAAAQGYRDASQQVINLQHE